MSLGEVAGLELVDRGERGGERDGEEGSSLNTREGESSRCGDFGHVTLSIPSVSVAFTSDSLIMLSNDSSGLINEVLTLVPDGTLIRRAKGPYLSSRTFTCARRKDSRSMSIASGQDSSVQELDLV